MDALHQPYKSPSIEESLTPPKTPPTPGLDAKLVHRWSESDTKVEEISPKEQSNSTSEKTQDSTNNDFTVTHQVVLLLHGPKQKYEYTREQPIPELEKDREMLVAVHTVGLNPIDWKAP
jgi:hypothetical protein